MTAFAEDFALLPTVFPLAFFTMFGLAALGAPMIAVSSQWLARVRKKSFYDKYAKQLTTMGLFCGLIALSGVTVAVISLATQLPQAKDFLISPSSGLLPVYGSILYTAIVLAVYWATWKRLKKQKPLHMTFGVLSALGGMLVLVSCLLASAHIMAPATSVQAPDAGGIFGALAPAMAAKVPALFATGFLLTLMHAGCLSTLWLVARRGKDDFGRDYYNFIMRYASLRSFAPAMALVLPTAWLVYLSTGFTAKAMTLVPALSLSVGSCIAGAILWFLVGRNENPMRQKPLLILAAVLALAAQCGFLLLAYKA